VVLERAGDTLLEAAESVRMFSGAFFEVGLCTLESS
jgi:hypothetical protein